jgi:hypothetical protein
MHQEITDSDRYFFNGPVKGQRGFNIGWDHTSDAYRNSEHCRDINNYRAASLGTGGVEIGLRLSTCL